MSIGLVLVLPLGGLLGDVIGSYIVSKKYAIYDRNTGSCPHDYDLTVIEGETISHIKGNEYGPFNRYGMINQSHETVPESTVLAQDRGFQVAMMGGLGIGALLALPAFALICTRTVTGAAIGQVFSQKSRAIYGLNNKLCC